MFTIMLLVTTVPAAYSQSAPAKVKIGEVEYSVTPISRGRMLQVSDANGGLVGMAGVNGGNVSVLAGPPATIKSVVDAYLHPTNGAATAAAPTTPPSPAAPATVDDPNAAQRAALMAKLDAITASAGNVARVNPAAPTQLSVEFPANGGAIVHGTKHGDITFNADATEARTVKPSVSGNPQVYLAKYEGGDKDSAGKDVGKTAGSLAVTLFHPYGNGGSHHIVTSDDRYEVDTETVSRGKVKDSKKLEAGGLASGLGGDTGGNLGNPVLDDVWTAEQFALTAAKSKQAAGETVNFDPQSTPRGQRAFKWLSHYEHAN